VLSDVRDCWLSSGDSIHDATYWPDLVAKDSATFGRPDIYLGGYATSPTSGIYDIGNAAEDLFSSLSTWPPGDTGTVLQRRNLVFVAHSLGGLVVRQLLVRHRAAFLGHSVGLVLMASPTLGSEFANSLGWLERVLHHAVGQQLQVGSPFITSLDQDFRNLLAERKFPLYGAEFCENHLIYSRLAGLVTRTEVVPPHSCTVYFGFNGFTRILANTDHFPAVKPDSRSHPSYRALVAFMQQEFVPAVVERDVQLNADVSISPTVFQRIAISRQIPVQVEISEPCGTQFSKRIISHVPSPLQLRSATHVLTAGDSLVRSAQLDVSGDSVVMMVVGQLPPAGADGLCKRGLGYTIVAAADSFVYTPLPPIRVRALLTPASPSVEPGIDLDTLPGVSRDAGLVLTYSAEVTGRTQALGTVALDFRSDAVRLGVRTSTIATPSPRGEFRSSKVLIDASQAFAAPRSTRAPPF
jgi:pimeloyl-ACP methyl ester carboxylesterase